MSKERLITALRTDGKLYISPELVVEVLYPGSVNANRDRELKRNLYARRGAEEYWIVDWQKRQLEVYRRKGSQLEFIELLNASDILQIPLLPGFKCQVGQLFATVYRQ
ncbi:MAG TPA: Uma2 family endonuclease [Ktedonobacteraceae bacterium]|jgi:Uma2 family endonuclease|nr:Uma2 family endonuclease [Ktedonobacteraceae bacterium]